MKNIKVASVQFNHSPGDKNYNLNIIRKFVEQASKEGVELIVFPEMCITGYWHVRNLSRGEIEGLAEEIPDGPSTKELLQLSSKYKMTLGAGLIEAADGNLFNSYVVAMPNGEFACHRKLHCFINSEMSSGDGYTVFDTPHGCRVGVLTCWDNNLIENARITALKGAEILLAPHQTGGCDSRSPGAMGLIDPELWHKRESNPDAIKAELIGPKGRGWLMRWLPSRAHDNGMFLVFSNGIGLDDNEVRTGNAMILDPYGQTLADTNEPKDDMVVANLEAETLKMCTGRRWIRGRRPDLYEAICEVSGEKLDARAVRFLNESD